jgi:hypothetical protein
MTVEAKLQDLARRWEASRAHERASAQPYLIELCEALGVERPRPPGSDYEFEYTIDAITVEGRESKNFIDLWKAGYFALEAKDDAVGANNGRPNETLLRKAFGQVRNYVAHTNGGPPPYLMVLDVARTLVVWDRWSGTYGGYNAGKRIDLPSLHERPELIALLRDIWENPAARDPRLRAQKVTEDVAARLAELAAALESRGFEQERVAKFLIRVVFSCFAEDIGLLPHMAFRETVAAAGVEGSPEQFASAMTALWRAMDAGGMFGFSKFLRFNGHFFREAEALPLTREDIRLLHEAAKADWADVEPSIFGTLLVRALDPEERHRLGAEYTPPAFIERLVRPTIEEPLRERWTAVQAAVLQLTESGKKRDRDTALTRLEEFHAWLRGLRFLDPACGSGNFLYLTMHTVKRIEFEVIRAIEELTGKHALRFEEVGPWQFYGIELKSWAREIAEMVLWIGFHQWWRRHHDVQPDEPILRDTGTLAHRDAVLEWDSIRHDPERDRPDQTPRVPHPVTGELVPDPAVRLRYDEYVGARPAPWPDADFIIGNPPYLGQFRQREVFGDGYVDALRRVYPEVPDAADYVMYWWYRAAEAVAVGRTIRAGLITTSSITQTQNRAVIAAEAERGARVCWAISDHVWYDGADGAEVRVAMTVIAKDPPAARLLTVEKVERVRGDVPVVAEIHVPRLNADLTAYADIASAARQPLRANEALASRGFMLFGQGFVMEDAEAQRLLAADARNADVIRPFRNGKDLTARPRGVSVLDFAVRDEAAARTYPVLFDLVRDRVKPERDANPEPSRRAFWWRFGRTNEILRNALEGLPRYIATPETSKHRIFVFLDGRVAPDNAVVCVGSDDAFVLGVLSSTTHVTWALAAGGRMGVRDTPRYNKGLCFDPFPFPDPPSELREHIGMAAEHIEQHRARALAADPDVTLMKMYDVVDALRGGRALSAAQQRVHSVAACGVLRDLHDTLDDDVAKAYGWSWPEPPALILERLVALHDERLREEQSGRVRWLRPDYQIPRFGRGAVEGRLDLPESDVAPAASALLVWPTSAVEQITAVKGLVVAGVTSPAEIASRFVGAKLALVERHLETLAILGELRTVADGRYAAVASV